MTENKKKGAIIPWDEAKLVIKHYQDMHPLPSAFGSAIPISSFKIPKEGVLEIVNQTDENEGKMFLSIGYHNDLPRSGESAGYTLIAFAVDSYGKLIKTVTSSAYDSKVGIISAAVALGTVQNYQNNTDLKINTIENKLLKGFNAVISELKAICSIEEVVNIEFLFAYRHISNDETVAVGYTIVIVGLDHTGDKITEDGFVYDYCHPCPNSCPIGA